MFEPATSRRIDGGQEVGSRGNSVTIYVSIPQRLTQKDDRGAKSGMRGVLKSLKRQVYTAEGSYLGNRNQDMQDEETRIPKATGGFWWSEMRIIISTPWKDSCMARMLILDTIP